MRMAVTILAVAAAACSPPTVDAGNRAAPMQAKVAPRACAADDTRCLVGRRGTAAAPCFAMTAALGPRVQRRTVFDRPDAKGRALGVILGETDNEEARAPQFEVRDGRDGWLRITGARDDAAFNGEVDRAMYHGTGWIRGEGLVVAAQTDQAFAAPDFDSAIVSDGKWFDGLPAELLIGCDGAWVHGRWAMPPHGKPVEGWVTGVCLIAETSCDGLSGNRPERR